MDGVSFRRMQQSCQYVQYKHHKNETRAYFYAFVFVTEKLVQTEVLILFMLPSCLRTQQYKLEVTENVLKVFGKSPQSTNQKCIVLYTNMIFYILKKENLVCCCLICCCNVKGSNCILIHIF